MFFFDFIGSKKMSDKDTVNTEADTQLNPKANRYVVKDYHILTQDKIARFSEKVYTESSKHSELQPLSEIVNGKLHAFLTAQNDYDTAKSEHNKDVRVMAYNHLIQALDTLADEVNHISHEIDFLSSTGFNLNKNTHAAKMPAPVQSIKLLDIMQAGTVKFKIIMPAHSYYVGFKIIIHCEDGTEITKIRTKKINTLSELQSGKSYTIKAAAWTPLSQEEEKYNYCDPVKVIVQ